MAQTLVTNTYTKGTAITFETSAPFTAVNGTIIDPDKVLFGFQINGDVDKVYTFTYTYGVGDHTGTIVRTGLGLYKASIDTSNYDSGTWTYSFACEPDSSISHDYTQTKIRKEGHVIVVDASFPMG
jgi:hypothetical protein